jgi:hypothetical protein
MVILRILFIFILCLIPFYGYSATHYASSACFSDVQTKYSAASAGDTIYVPATSASDSCYAGGYSNWGTNTLLVTKAVKFIGAGHTLTKIHGEYTPSFLIPTDTTDNGFFYVRTGDTSAEFALEITGFEFNQDNGGKAPNIIISGAGYNWRIHHNYFNNSDNKKRELFIMPSGDGTCFGLIDNNIGYFLKVRIQGSGVAVAHKLWQMDAQWSTDDAVFVENNIFTGLNYDPDTSTMPQAGNVVDGSNGSRLVFRYNDCYNCNLESHGACSSSSGPRGIRSYEVYNNRIFGIMPSGTALANPVQNMGGAMVVTRNKFLGYFTSTQSGVKVVGRRSSHDSNCTTYGFCDGTSNYDGKLENSAHGGMVDGYICLDQVGAGTWTGTWGTTSTHTSDPTYIWNNISVAACRAGVNKYQTCTSNDDCLGSTCGAALTYPNRAYRHNDTYYTPYQIVAGRDYYDSTVAGYPNARPDWVAYTCPHPLADPNSNGSCDTSKYGSNLWSAENVTSEGGYVLTGGDTTDPVVSISTDDPSAISVDSLTVEGTASDAVGVTSCRWKVGEIPTIDTVNECTGTTSFSCATSGYTPGGGDNIAYVACFDAAGNRGYDQIVVTFTTADETAPETTISTADPSNIVANALTVEGTATDAVGVIDCKWRRTSAPDAENGTDCDFSAPNFSCSTSGYSDGNNNLYVGCYDAAGNYGSDSIVVNYTQEDTTKPEVTITTSDSTIYTDYLTVEGTSSDNVLVVGCKYNIGAEVDATHGSGCINNLAGTLWACMTSGYAQGANTLYVSCYDGNANYATNDSITVTNNTDVTAPTVTAFWVYADTTNITFSENITATSGAAFTVTMSGGEMTLTCPAVSTASTTMTCTNSRTVYQAETGTYGYTGTKVEDTAENDLAEIATNPAIVNMSTEVETPPARTLTVNKTGFGCGITSTPTGISCVGACASGNTANFENGTSVQLGGWLYNGWSGITYGGDCNESGVVTMDGDKTCTVTCTPDYTIWVK